MRVFRVVCVMVLVALASTVGAEEPRADGASGYATRVPLTVPSYRGLAPGLALSYHSSRKGGFAGVGWELAGPGIIERQGPTGGVPRYDRHDVFVYRGEELISCAELGGTHCTRRQSYRRIVRDENADRWRVWAPSGVSAVYEPVFVTSMGTYRWALTEVVDPHGRRVHYTYACDSDTSQTYDCYAESIAYNGVTITFYREARPDPRTFGTGASLGQTRYRLKTIDMQRGGQRVRAYRLAYAATAGTARSVLSEVQTYGRDAVVNVSGEVTAGTALPPARFSYAEAPLAFSAVHDAIDATQIDESPTRVLTGDFNGDGRSDVLFHWGATGANRFYLARADGTFEERLDAILPGDIDEQPDHISAGDFDGDGRSDLLFHWMATGANRFYFSGADGSFAAHADPISRGQIDNYTEIVGYDSNRRAIIRTRYVDIVRVGDFNGDGKSDILFQWSHSGINQFYFANDDGTFEEHVEPLDRQQIADYPDHIQVGDFNGDGRSDIVYHFKATGQSRLYLSQGDGTVTQYVNPIQTSYIDGEPDHMVVGDLNGDGLTDLGFHWNDSGQNRWFLSHGDGTFSPRLDVIPAEELTGSPDQVAATDFNGDGLDDLLFYWKASGASRWYLSRGDGTFVRQDAPLAAPELGGNPDNVLLADFNGDGKPDLGFHVGSSGDNRWQWSRHAVEGVLQEVQGSVGGVTQVVYTPSPAWQNAYLPVGTVLQTVSEVTVRDGRGGAITTRYSYAGGLWDGEQRRFLGFRMQRATDATGAYRETVFTQHVADPLGTVQDVYKKDAEGHVYTYRHREYVRSGDGRLNSFRSHVAESWRYECNGDFTCRVTLQTYGHDAYGNVTAMVNFGDYHMAGDERTTLTSYYPNEVAYLVRYPGSVVVRAGIGTTGARLWETRITYDDAESHHTAPVRGNATRLSAWRDATDTFVTRAATYDAFGNVVAATDPLGNTSTTVFDSAYHQFPVSVTNALGHTATTTWDPTCEAAFTATDVNEQTTTMIRDPLCRPIRVDHPDGSHKTKSYVGFGNPELQHVQVAVSDGTDDELWTRSYFDGLSRTYRAMAEPDRTALIEYDSRGLVARRSAVHRAGEEPRWTSVDYDALARPTLRIHADGSAAEVAYDDWKTTTYDERGVPKERFYDARGRLVRIREHLGSQAYETSLDYDRLGRRSRLTDAAGNVTRWTFDSLGNQTEIQDPDAGTWRSAYNDAGWLVSRTDARGHTLAWSHDALGRPTVRRAGAQILEQRFYDEGGHGAGIGRLSRALDASGSHWFSYDALGRSKETVRVIDGVAYTVKRAYDAAGRLRDLTYPDGETVRYTYDEAGRLATVGGYITGSTYDARSALLSRSHCNGVADDLEYDPVRFRLSRKTTHNGPDVLDDIAYEWDTRGELLAKTSSLDPHDSWRFAYDNLGRLTQADNLGRSDWSEAFSYDAVGNLTHQTSLGDYTYPPPGTPRPHAPLFAGGHSFVYDANGNRTSGAGRTHIYDVENRLVETSGTRHVYDGRGARVKAGAQVFVGDLYETDGETWTKYYYAGAKRVARRDSDGGVYYYHGDQIGTAHKMTDASGTEASHRVYSAFGRLIEGVGLADPFGLGDQRLDDTNLYYLRARYMDPATGQFLSPDPSNPLRPGVGVNRYAYALNNPVRFRDPSGFAAGMMSESAVGGELNDERTQPHSDYSGNDDDNFDHAAYREDNYWGDSGGFTENEYALWEATRNTPDRQYDLVQRIVLIDVLTATPEQLQELHLEIEDNWLAIYGDQNGATNLHSLLEDVVSDGPLTLDEQLEELAVHERFIVAGGSEFVGGLRNMLGTIGPGPARPRPTHRLPPGYSYDRNLNRYRDPSGRFVAPSNIPARRTPNPGLPFSVSPDWSPLDDLEDVFD